MNNRLPKLALQQAPRRVQLIARALRVATVRDAHTVPAGTWWLWSRSTVFEPSWAVLEAIGRGSHAPPRNVPPQLKRRWRSIRPHTFELVRTASAKARAENLSPRECLHILALLTQRQQPTRAERLAELVIWIYTRFKRVRTRAAVQMPAIWAGNHIGPTYAAKSENQDATYVVRGSERHVFALADGVSTSVGAQYAASIAVREFCSALDKLSSMQLEPRDALMRAARSSQEHLESRLNQLLQNAKHPEWSTLRASSRMPQDSALHLLRNTLSRSNPRWAPQMATTLLGGMLCRTKRGLALHLIRIGDGVVELTSSRGAVTTVLPMDTNETALSTYLCPGPNGKASIERAEYVVLKLPKDSERILVSSDGLARGHGEPIAYALNAACPDRLHTLDQTNASAAHDVLAQAASYADRRFKQKHEEYFGDNLSLIVINCNAQEYS